MWFWKKSFSRTLSVPSKAEDLYEVLDFISSCLSRSSPSKEVISQLQLVVEEVFVNISKYAYQPPGSGDVKITCAVEKAMMKVTLTFEDSGQAFDPLQKPDPDTSEPLDDRKIGGLGIFLVKNHVDGISYRREDGKNILTIEKSIANHC